MKKKVFLYKEGCTPRIFINPSEEEIEALRKEGVVLINPNEGSVKGVVLAHTYPDEKNNLLRRVPVADQVDIKSLKSPVEGLVKDMAAKKVIVLSDDSKALKEQIKKLEQEMVQKKIQLDAAIIMVDEQTKKIEADMEKVIVHQMVAAEDMKRMDEEIIEQGETPHQLIIEAEKSSQKPLILIATVIILAMSGAHQGEIEVALEALKVYILAMVEAM